MHQLVSCLAVNAIEVTSCLHKHKVSTSSFYKKGNTQVLEPRIKKFTRVLFSQPIVKGKFHN